MSPPEVWGPAVWTLFHTLTEKVNEHAYPFIKHQLFGQIRRICGFLPCPECSADATNFLVKININDLKTKVDFRNTFYLFHNMVNAKKRKPLFNYSNISSYNSYNIVHVVNNFISKYNTKGNMKLIAESFQRKIVLGEFKSWFIKTILAFTPPQNVPSPISLVTNESLSQEVVVEEPIVVEEVVTEEPIVTEEVLTEEVITEEPIVVEEVVAEEPIVEEVVTEEPLVVEVVVEEVVTEEPIVVEEVVTEEVVTEEVVTEEVVTEELPVTEEIVQPKSKKGKKTKKQ